MTGALSWLCLSFVTLAVAQSTPKPDLAVGSQIRDTVDKWARLYSGKPVSCLEPQFLFTQGVQIETSNSSYYGIGGVNRHCGDSYSSFEHVETFVTGQVFLGLNTAAFSRTTLYVNDVGCRIVSHGIVTFDFVPSSLLISRWRDYYDAANLSSQIANCTLPLGGDDATPDAGPQPTGRAEEIIAGPPGLARPLDKREL